MSIAGSLHLYVDFLQQDILVLLTDCLLWEPWLCLSSYDARVCRGVCCDSLVPFWHIAVSLNFAVMFETYRNVLQLLCSMGVLTTSLSSVTIFISGLTGGVAQVFNYWTFFWKHFHLYKGILHTCIYCLIGLYLYLSLINTLVSEKLLHVPHLNDWRLISNVLIENTPND